MELDAFTRSCRNLVQSAGIRGSVTLADVERETGHIDGEVFEDVLTKLQEDGLVVVDEPDPPPAADVGTVRRPGTSAFLSGPIESDRIYYRDLGRLPLLDREGEVRLARRRIKQERALGRLLSRTVPVADVLMDLLRDVIDGRLKAAAVVRDVPRPTASPRRGRPSTIEARYKNILRVRRELIAALHAECLQDGCRSREVVRCRFALSRAVVSANPVVGFWYTALERVGQIIEELLRLRDRSALETVRRPRPGRRGVDVGLNPIDFRLDNLAYLRRVKRRAETVSERLTEVRQEFAEANVRLVSLLARRRHTVGGFSDYDDRCQAGNRGLMRAVDGFDPDRGCKFSTYATWWIRQAITRQTIEFGMDIRVPVHVADSARRFKAWRAEYREVHGEFPDTARTAEEFGVTEAEVRRWSEVPAPSQSLDEPLGSGDRGVPEPLAARVADPDGVDPEREYLGTQLSSCVEGVLADLLDRDEEQVVRQRFGFPPRPGFGQPKFVLARQRALRGVCYAQAQPP